MSDSRTAFRYKTHRPAKIFVTGGGTIEACVRDLSTKGACIEVDPKEVPSDFFMMIQGLSERFRCHVVWKNGAILGVQYLYN